MLAEAIENRDSKAIDEHSINVNSSNSFPACMVYVSIFLMILGNFVFAVCMCCLTLTSALTLAQ